MKKKISILGSTGSIGKQTLEVCELLDLPVVALSAKSSIDLLVRQAVECKPEYIAIEDKSLLADLQEKCASYGLTCTIEGGREAVLKAAVWPTADTVVAAMVGMAGLEPVVQAIKSGKDIALANKETLVAAGYLVMNLARENNVALLPVDSEHSAIWQCLQTGQENELSRILLTCSGGPFRGKTTEDLAQVTVKEALAHPVWSMGGKISIDSATLMNKGLELIEACHLFHCGEDQIQVVVHPESIIHSMVEWVDHSVIAQLGFPDMRLPIQLALTWPKRSPSLERAFDPFGAGASVLHFEEVNEEVFPAIRLARWAQQEGNRLPIVFNAANEIAVHFFLEGKITFLQISELVEYCMNQYAAVSEDIRMDLTKIIELDRKARKSAEELIQSWVN